VTHQLESSQSDIFGYFHFMWSHFARKKPIPHVECLYFLFQKLPGMEAHPASLLTSIWVSSTSSRGNCLKLTTHHYFLPKPRAVFLTPPPLPRLLMDRQTFAIQLLLV
jgi:hypothetical protein